MRVSLRTFTTLREIVGEQQLNFSFDGALTLKSFILYLSERYGKRFHDYVFDEGGNFRGYIRFFINGEPVKNSDVEQIKLRDGDVVAIIPPVSGG